MDRPLFARPPSNCVTKNNDTLSTSPHLRAAQATTSTPLVSVIVPTFNRPEMLKETLASIDAQTYAPIEIVVVNDGGMDIEPLLAPLNGERKIVHLKHVTNRGLPAARNTGIKAAS